MRTLSTDWFDESSPEEIKSAELEIARDIERRRYMIALAEKYAEENGIEFSSGYWRGYCLYKIGYVPPALIAQFVGR